MTSMVPVYVGPWGGSGGNHSYTLKGKIKKIYARSDDTIQSIKFVYSPPGSEDEKESEWFGTSQGGYLFEMDIDEDDEIKQFGGTFGTYKNSKVITCLYFTTSNGNHEVFGSANGESFSVPITTGKTKLFGFFGKYGGYLDSFGAFLVPK